jgi:hypothetical protein
VVLVQVDTGDWNVQVMQQVHIKQKKASTHESKYT